MYRKSPSRKSKLPASAIALLDECLATKYVPSRSIIPEQAIVTRDIEVAVRVASARQGDTMGHIRQRLNLLDEILDTLNTSAKSGTAHV